MHKMHLDMNAEQEKAEEQNRQEAKRRFNKGNTAGSGGFHARTAGKERACKIFLNQETTKSETDLGMVEIVAREQWLQCSTCPFY